MRHTSSQLPSERSAADESRAESKPRRTRRNFFKLTGAAGVFGLAGCLGGTSDGGGGGSDGGGSGGNGGGKQAEFAMTGAGSFSLGTAQAMQRALRQESEKVNLNVTEVPGNPVSIQQYDQGKLKSYSTENFTIVSALNGNDPFQEKRDVAPQGFVNLLFHYYWMAVDGSGLETTDDLIEQDVNVWPFPPAWGSRRVQEVIHQNAGIWDDIKDNVVNLNAGDVPGAIEEGRIQAFYGQGATYQGLPGWAKEIDARHDVHVLETSDTLLEGVEKTDAINQEEIEPYGWEQDVGADTLTAWNNGVQFCFSEDVSDEVVYEIARISHEHPDVLREAMPQYMDHSDPESMVENLLPDIPVHPGAADFMEEKGVWNDDLERA